MPLGYEFLSWLANLKVYCGCYTRTLRLVIKLQVLFDVKHKTGSVPSNLPDHSVKHDRLGYRMGMETQKVESHPFNIRINMPSKKRTIDFMLKE